MILSSAPGQASNARGNLLRRKLAVTMTLSRKPAKKSKPIAKSAPKPAPRKASGPKRVFFFGKGKAEGNTAAATEAQRKLILGGKGQGLADMTSAGLPVPPGFTISIPCCEEYYQLNRRLSDQTKREVAEALAKVEAAMKQKDLTITVSLGTPGKATHRVYTCDLSREYITINADYHT